MQIRIQSPQGAYDVTIRRGAIYRKTTFENVPLGEKTLFVTDDGVPEQYVKEVASHFVDPIFEVFPQGEASKSAENYLHLLKTMTELAFSRRDRVISVGGGMAGDLAGFAAATYMRGIDFYNVPTTFLAQIDASVGGKTAIDFCGVKNVAGAFYSPRGVIVDPDLLSTLPKRQLHAGIAEAVKTATVGDEKLFSLLERSEDFEKNVEEIIFRSLKYKQSIVERDPKEENLRKVLNFGHTLGHAIESEYGGALLHGECVALGMLPFSSPALRKKLTVLLQKYDLPVKIAFSKEKAENLLLRDKKAEGKDDLISAVFAEDIENYSFKSVSVGEILRLSEVLL